MGKRKREDLTDEEKVFYDSFRESGVLNIPMEYTDPREVIRKQEQSLTQANERIKVLEGAVTAGKKLADKVAYDRAGYPQKIQEALLEFQSVLTNCEALNLKGGE